MLTLHTFRSYLITPRPSCKELPTQWQSELDMMFWIWFLVGLAIGALVLIVTISCMLPLHSFLGKPLCLFGIVFFVLVFGVQLAAIGKAYIDKFARITVFYWKLSGARASKEREVPEYVESYRHLREHSNAYAILILELLLAPVLALTQEPWQLVPVALLWLLPPACCWLIATVLEVRLAYHE